jgi:hypothetical protein
MLQAGLDFIAQRDKQINARAAHNRSKGTGRHARPSLTDFWRCGLQAICKNADSWCDQAVFTNFIAVFVFSIVKGVNCEYLDNFELSDAELLSSKTKQAQSVAKTKTDEEGAAKAGPQFPEESESCDVAESSRGKEAAVLTIMSAGEFWLQKSLTLEALIVHGIQRISGQILHMPTMSKKFFVIRNNSKGVVG